MPTSRCSIFRGCSPSATSARGRSSHPSKSAFSHCSSISQTVFLGPLNQLRPTPAPPPTRQDPHKYSFGRYVVKYEDMAEVAFGKPGIYFASITVNSFLLFMSGAFLILIGSSLEFVTNAWLPYRHWVSRQVEETRFGPSGSKASTQQRDGTQPTCTPIRGGLLLGARPLGPILATGAA